MHEESSHQQVLRIKNMVCPRCITAVQHELEKLGLRVLEVVLGSATVEASQDLDISAIEAALVSQGFELILDKQEDLVESIKIAVIDLIRSEKIATLATNVSTYLAYALGKDYSTISTAFKASEGVALSRFVVLQKVERAKELLSYDELSKAEIATRLGYKSLQHLSSQFKEVTGFTLLQYKKNNNPQRNSIDNLLGPS
ncbi:helix-turn-helix domain-containing protein [Pontibacter cellulosilyticus]|uniref:Helix-turn-helix domain-containing protein n=1 Tax=Pontibacter cellulosilyticus TaxID=1720253 RepID=A0A923SKN9_9BACT|nr:AraC family transcriptional regulator [Pontibacter cellulosilyticus]MBC5995078.1 helix-turn-helix domain-containing protein [Pontibacter cellulosilyticus]